MLMKSSSFLLLLTVLQVSARYKNVEPNIVQTEFKSAVLSSSSRIVSGWEARPGQHPHHAALRFVNAAGGMRKCGGSIVSKEWVITSAFCTVGRILAIVRAGGVSLTNPEYIFESAEWYNHPAFNNLSSFAQQNDISLVKLQRPLVYTRLVKPIRLPSRADAYRSYDGEQVYTSGHGLTETGHTSDVLRWVYLRVIPDATCRRTYSVNNDHICAQFFNVSSQSSCNDDHGGPLVHVGNDGVPILIGITYIVSSVVSNCNTDTPTAFTRPGPYLSWFEEVTGIDFENLQEDDDNVDTTTTSSTSTTTDSTIITTTDSGEQGPDENTTAPSEDSEDNEEDSESNEDDMVQLLKRLEVNVKVKVALNKYNVTKYVGKDISV